MMWKTKRYAYASALPAIAAALALSSTPAWSQEVQPAPEPDPVTIDAPPPVVDSPPTTTDSAPTTDAVSEPTVATEAAPVAAKPKAKTTATKSTRTTTAKKPTATKVASAAAPAAAAPVAATVPEAAPSMPQPIVDARPPAEQAAIAPESTKPALNVNETTMMLGGGALALLALGGAGLGMASRRRRKRQELADEAAMDQPMTIEPEPSPRHDAIHEEQPAIVAPSAFSWGEPQPVDRNIEPIEGETWVERAYRGPTPENPSLSLRKRLKRANFFDARERRVAAGKAEPVDVDAGLPENVANDTRERELELA